MGKTIQVASDRAHDDTKTVLPREYAQGIYIEHPPSAEALKLLHMMIASAGSHMADAVQHSMNLADIRAVKGMRNHDRKSLTPLFRELRACVLSIDDPVAMRYTIGGFLDTATFDYRHEVTGDITVSWWFGGAFRMLAEKSNHWAIIDRQTLFALSSKYSILLFQHFTTLQGLKHQTSKTLTLVELRNYLGIADNKHKRFSELNRWALKPAFAEINQLSRFTLTATPNKIGRTVVSVKISWEPKSDIKAVKNTLLSPLKSVKHSGDITPPIPAKAFPASGSIEFSKPWNEIAKLNGNGKDKDLIATDFRNWCQARNIPLDRPNIEKTFKGFCKKAMP